MKAKKLNGNTVLLIITIALFFVMYAVGCVIYSNKGFTHLQTFLNILINNAGLLCITAVMPLAKNIPAIVTMNGWIFR
jgi:galactofuranose transport system permease protein